MTKQIHNKDSDNLKPFPNLGSRDNDDKKKNNNNQKMNIPTYM